MFLQNNPCIYFLINKKFLIEYTVVHCSYCGLFNILLNTSQFTPKLYNNKIAPNKIFLNEKLSEINSLDVGNKETIKQDLSNWV